MRILLVHQYFLEQNDPGGSRFNEMTKQWAEMGHEITVLAGMVNGATGLKNAKYKRKIFYQENIYHNIKVIRSYTSGAYNINFIGRLWGYFSYMVSSIFAGLIYTKGKYDVVLVTSPPLFVGISGFLLAKIKRAPFVFEIRDLWPESAIDTGVLTNRFIINLSYKVESLLYRKAQLINVLTPAFKTVLLEKKQVLMKKIVYLPNASDFTLSDDLLNNFDGILFRKELGLENKFIITYVGAHGVANHLIQLIDTADIFRNSNVHFLLIGDGMKKQELVEEVNLRKLKNVTFLDPVPKKAIFKYIIASDVGVSILKKADTFKTIYSNKTFDYMACKKPVLMVIDGVSRELVETAKCGVYAEPENIVDICRAIEVLKEQSNLIQMGENGYLYAKENFDRKKIGSRYIDILDQINA